MCIKPNVLFFLGIQSGYIFCAFWSEVEPYIELGYGQWNVEESDIYYFYG